MDLLFTALLAAGTLTLNCTYDAGMRVTSIDQKSGESVVALPTGEMLKGTLRASQDQYVGVLKNANGTPRVVSLDRFTGHMRVGALDKRPGAPDMEAKCARVAQKL